VKTLDVDWRIILKRVREPIVENVSYIGISERIFNDETFVNGGQSMVF